MRVRWLIAVALVLVALGAVIPLATKEVLVARADYPKSTRITDSKAMFASSRRFSFLLPEGIIESTDDYKDGMVVEDVKAGQVVTVFDVAPAGSFGWTTIGGMEPPGPRTFEIELPPAKQRTRDIKYISGDRVDVLDQETERVLLRGLTVLRVHTHQGVTTVTVQVFPEQALLISNAQQAGRLDLSPSREDD